MDHTQVGSAEEGCSSCESGWTDYLVSPVNSTDEDMVDDINSDDTGEGHEGNDIRSNRKGSDNDSLASDASSGPSHRKRAGKNSRTSRYVKDEEEETGSGQSNGDSSGGSYKIDFNGVKKEKAMDRKATSNWEGANTSAFHGRNEVGRKK